MKLLNVKTLPPSQACLILENAVRQTISLYKKLKVWKSLRTMPNQSLIACAMQNIHKICSDYNVKGIFSNEPINEVAEQMLTEVIQVCSSRTPFIAIRARLASAISELAKYQVLVLSPPTNNDETGIRGAEVTGMLRDHILEFNNKNQFNPWGTNCDLYMPSHEELLEAFMTRYHICKAKAELFMTLDAFMEGATDLVMEWHDPFIHSMCAQYEHYFRLSLGMPSVLDIDPVRAKIIACEHQIYYNLVKNGVDDPHESWEAIVSHIESEEINDQLATYHLYLSQYPH
jgi:hypothetical protein